MKLFLSIAAALAILVSARASQAAGVSYTGHWPVIVTGSHHADGTYCLRLTQNRGRMGQASLIGQRVIGTLNGSFEIIGPTLVATLQTQSNTGQNAGLVFAARTANGTLGRGFFENVYGGEDFDSGNIVFGAKNGC